MTIYSSDVTTTGFEDHAIDVGNSADAFILEGVTITAENSLTHALYAVRNNIVEVYGTLLAPKGPGIDVAPDAIYPDQLSSIVVGEDGVVSSAYAAVSMDSAYSSITSRGDLASRWREGIAT